MEGISKVIIFQINNEQYGVNIKQVRSIERLQSVTALPQTPDFIKGVINHRGDVTPIIDLKERLHIGKTEYTDDTRVLIINIDTIQVGLIVDLATEVVDIDPSIIGSPPEMVGKVTEDYLIGVAKLEKKLLILLDLERLLTIEQLNEVKEIVEN